MVGEGRGETGKVRAATARNVYQGPAVSPATEEEEEGGPWPRRHQSGRSSWVGMGGRAGMGIGQGHSQYQTSIACATTTTTLVRDLFQDFFPTGGAAVYTARKKEKKKRREAGAWALRIR